MLDEVGLIHMNGRVYDPTLARFVSADPLIDGVTSVQGYNRYAYVHNNPLTYTDPSGYSSWNKYRDSV
ncbi:RHS repeat-associated core domain-containing protein [Microbulbifer sp. NBRC 101763]